MNRRRADCCLLRCRQRIDMARRLLLLYAAAFACLPCHLLLLDTRYYAGYVSVTVAAAFIADTLYDAATLDATRFAMPMPLMILYIIKR